MSGAVAKLDRRVLEELVFQRLAHAVDDCAVFELQGDLLSSVTRAARPDSDPVSLARLARRVLRRAWRRYGEEVVMVLNEAHQAGQAPAE